MKILVNIYHDIDTEARTQEILGIMSQIGNTTFLSFSENKIYSDVKTLLTGRGKRNYYTFVRDSIKYIKKEKPDVVVFHDNYCALIYAILYRWLKKNKVFVIYDSSELYFDKKGNTIKEKIATIMQKLENKYIAKSDLIIAANEERASIMKDVFKLREVPYVVDNIHRIEEQYDEMLCNEKFSKYICKDKFIILYAGGVSYERRTFDLLESVEKIGNSVSLIIVGSALENDVKEFNRQVREKKVDDRVFYLGFISRKELKYLLNKADISVSLFEQNCLNNKYCASGKVYESLFEITPILVSDNPPLKRLCETFNVGVSTDNLFEGIVKLYHNLEYYKANVKEYIGKIDYDNRLCNYSSELRKIIYSKMGERIENS